MPAFEMTNTAALPADWRDFVALTKPRVMSLVVFSGLCGLLVAPVRLPLVLGFTAILCIALGAGACGALNQWYEADIDAKMHRTAKRPLPAGRMDRQSALHFGVGLAGIESTRRQIFLYTVPMVAAAVAPWPLGLAGPAYGVSAAVLSFVFLVLAGRVAVSRVLEPSGMDAEKHLFAYSVFYLFALFAVLVADRWLPWRGRKMRSSAHASATERGARLCSSAQSSCCWRRSPRPGR